MPQNKEHVESLGIYSALRGDLWPLLKTYPADAEGLLKACGPREIHSARGVRPAKRNEILDPVIGMLSRIAVTPTAKMTLETTPPDFLFSCYANAPDLVIAILRSARKVWFKKSKARRIFTYMAAGTGVRPLPHQEIRSVWRCTDGEIATGYKLATGEAVEISDVVKARKQLAAAVSRKR